jgi:hypothetical protein
MISIISCIGAMDNASKTISENITCRITSPAMASKQCIDFIIALHDQPLFYGRGSSAKKCKVLPLEEIDSRITDLLYENTVTKLGKHCMVHCFGLGNHQLFDIQGKRLGFGITQWLYDDVLIKNNDEDIKAAFASGLFESTCNEVVKELFAGWKLSTLAENPDILHHYSEAEWCLLIKPKKLKRESLLVGLFLTAADIICTINSEKNMAKCSDDMKFRCENVDEKPAILYMWIKKQFFSEVCSRLGLSIQQ